jgi:hypothetical protein
LREPPTENINHTLPGTCYPSTLTSLHVASFVCLRNFPWRLSHMNRGLIVPLALGAGFCSGVLLGVPLPQQESVATFKAAWAYFSLTSSFMSILSGFSHTR